MIELSIVILIIGLLMAFVLAASQAGLEAARVRATQALITKLSVGLEERLEALLSTTVNPTGVHQWLASIPINAPPFPAAQANALPWGLQSGQRAQVIARLDQIRAEFPDVFYIDRASTTSGPYPIKFGGVPFNWPDKTFSYNLPLGTLPGTANIRGNTYAYIPNERRDDPTLYTGPGYADGSLGTGINGASYNAAASLYKIVGFGPTGYDGVDNDGKNGVDDLVGEGLVNAETTTVDGVTDTKWNFFLNKHQHKTARAEMLYALLVEGIGPLGSVFSRADFRDNEIRDTDNDGVPEFVDGWGQPLQFFRWPIAYQSESQALNTALQAGLQKGGSLYNNAGEPRQQNGIDPNGQLMAVAWWGTVDPADSTLISQPSVKCLLVQNLFGPMADPNWTSTSATTNPGYMWDRSGATGRRAYFSRFLILSSGPDLQPGVPLMDDASISAGPFQTVANRINGTVAYDTSKQVFNFTVGESWAQPLPGTIGGAWSPLGLLPEDDNVSRDDITNHELPTRAGGF